jgi:phosphoadenosine phosphosulfate reductase
MSLDELSNLLREKTAPESLEILIARLGGNVIFTTSFGLEDQVITDMIFENNLPIEVVTLDTGRLFPETYKVFNETLKKYSKPITLFFPDDTAVEKMVTEKGPYSFYYSKEDRIECCSVRKIGPLNRALVGRSCWITGIRAEQSVNRHEMSSLELDNDKNLFKFHPLFSWSFEEVRSYIREHNIPYNSLHDKGFVSIGCEPCTRAVREGEDFRAGRWWWETGGKKECGLHDKK